MDAALFTPVPYVSPPHRPALFPRLLPSVYFYPRLLATLLNAGMRARKNQYSGADWARHSEDVTRSLEAVGCRFTVEGSEHFRSLEGPCVFAANHMSTMETMVLPAMIQPWKDVTFVIKRSLFRYPLFDAVLTARNPIAVDRVNPREDLKTVLDEGEKRLAAGMSVVVFPQSTRQLVFDPTKFNSIAVKLARRAAVPVIPLALYTAAWSDGRLLSDFGPIRPERPVRFRFGPPLRIQGNGKAEQAALCDFISREFCSLNLASAA